MSKSQSPLLGYNTNIRHKGKTYHVQTEDSGFNRPHIITHIFADGGRIVASRKTDYSKRLHEENLEEIVRGLMKEQHKDMLIALRDDVYEGCVSSSVSSTIETISSSAASSSSTTELKANIPLHSDLGQNTPQSDSSGQKNRLGQSAHDLTAFDKAAEARIQRSSLRSVLVPRARKSQPPQGAGQPPARIRKDSEVKNSKPRIVSIFGNDPSSEKSLDDVIISYLTDDDRKKK
jgi:hypothetical protein